MWRDVTSRQAWLARSEICTLFSVYIIVEFLPKYTYLKLMSNYKWHRNKYGYSSFNNWRREAVKLHSYVHSLNLHNIAMVFITYYILPNCIMKLNAHQILYLTPIMAKLGQIIVTNFQRNLLYFLSPYLLHTTRDCLTYNMINYLGAIKNFLNWIMDNIILDLQWTSH